MFKFKNMKHLFLYTIIILLSKSVYAEAFFSVRDVSNIYMQPSVDSPIIYPIEQGKKLILKKKQDEWANVLDEKTGLVGWIQKELISKKKQKNSPKANNYKD